VKENTKRAQQAKTLRNFRKIHRWTGAVLFVFFFLIGVTGLLLGWKKNSNGYLTPNTQKGKSTNFEEWRPMSELHASANEGLQLTYGNDIGIGLDRVDVKQDKGVANFIFEKNYWAVQVDGATGKVLSVDKRRADFIENLHDGLIVDKYANWKSQPFKLVYTSIMGLALITFTITGFWLWYGPKMMRKE
jgi:uncharacterized iron-regulated membrane protein